MRRSLDRGSADHGWLKTRYSFSFADYYDPEQMGFGVLRVINDDRIAGGGGFPMHAHRDMEILTYIIEGALEHRDSMGNTGVISAGEIQQMSAGTGVRHSEFNASGEASVHLLQIWIVPDKAGYEPKYDQKDFSARLANSEFVLLASRSGREGSAVIHQDVDLFAVKSKIAGQKTHALGTGRGLWLQVIRGGVTGAGVTLTAGDGLGLTDVDSVDLSWSAGAEFLIFDLAV
ncbi:MAG: pirin family protein [Bdellovibrionaceae bacterium]|nr:pirin family protein [Pseudobdellovibrionaceae bacterium]